VLYSLIYYRALGLVTIASLLVSGALTYACLVILGREIGFTLTLAGIAGFIVAVGITADSFVVFFERIKDEVHEGRTMRVAVPRAWVRARRTILSADTVSFLAAAILYYFAAGDVQGFAFTLGLSTILDLVVVFLFTHPLISLLSRSRTFGSARFTGLNSAREGGVAVLTESPRRAPAPRRTRPASRSAGQAATRGGGVAVLDAEDDIADTADAGEASDGGTIDRFLSDDPAPAHETIPAGDEAGGDTADEITADEITEDGSTGNEVAESVREPRRRSAPEPGTAAERAAARRARMRAKNDEGES
jgi:preprotein translocase subunit SecD